MRVPRPSFFIGRTGTAYNVRGGYANILWHITNSIGTALCGTTTDGAQVYSSGLHNFYASMNHRCRKCREAIK